jgi:hypothetical protein
MNPIGPGKRLAAFTLVARGEMAVADDGRRYAQPE